MSAGLLVVLGVQGRVLGWVLAQPWWLLGRAWVTWIPLLRSGMLLGPGSLWRWLALLWRSRLPTEPVGLTMWFSQGSPMLLSRMGGWSHPYGGAPRPLCEGVFGCLCPLCRPQVLRTDCGSPHLLMNIFIEHLYIHTYKHICTLYIFLSLQRLCIDFHQFFIHFYRLTLILTLNLIISSKQNSVYTLVLNLTQDFSLSFCRCKSSLLWCCIVSLHFPPLYFYLILSLLTSFPTFLPFFPSKC